MRAVNIRTSLEIIGGVAIVVSLLFVGYELKRANDIAEADATATVYQAANEFLALMIDDQQARDVIRKAFGDEIDSLTDDESQILSDLMTYIYNIGEVSWKYHKNGLMSKADLSVRFNELCSFINGSHLVAADWNNRRSVVLPGFYEDVTRKCSKEMPE